VGLVGPAGDPTARTPARLVARGLATAPFERPSMAVLGALDYAAAGPRVLAAEMRTMTAHQLEAVLPRVAAPVRVARGARDAAAPQRWVELVAAAAGAPAPVVVPGEGHAVQYDAPDAVAAFVLDLARTVAAARRAPPGARPAA
jgi:pimeloyl-ACP methyl ester carboxylesterase